MCGEWSGTNVEARVDLKNSAHYDAIFIDGF